MQPEVESKLFLQLARGDADGSVKTSFAATEEQTNNKHTTLQSHQLHLCHV